MSRPNPFVPGSEHPSVAATTVTQCWRNSSTTTLKTVGGRVGVPLGHTAMDLKRGPEVSTGSYDYGQTLTVPLEEEYGPGAHSIRCKDFQEEATVQGDVGYIYI